MDDKNSSSSINPWPTRGSKRDEDSASERGPSDLVSFDNSVKDGGQSCGSSTDGFTVKNESSTFGSQSSKLASGFENSPFRGTQTGFPSYTRKSFGSVLSRGSIGFGTTKTGFGRSREFAEISGFGAASNTGFGAASSTGFGAASNTGFGVASSTGFGVASSTGFGVASSTGFGGSFGSERTKSGGFGGNFGSEKITSGGFGSGSFFKSSKVNEFVENSKNDETGSPIVNSGDDRSQQHPKVETQSTKSENLLTKDSGFGSYYAKVDMKELEEAPECHSPLGNKKETLFDEHREYHHNNNTPRKRGRTKKNTRHEKCYHCHGFGHFSKYCPHKEMFGDSGFQNRNNGDSNNTKGFRPRLRRNSGNDYFSAYRYTDRDDKHDREKGDDQLTKNLDAIFPIVQNDDDHKTPQKLQHINANNRVPINSLRSSNNQAFQQPSQSPRSVNLNLDGLCINPLVAPSSSNRENKEAYHTIETRRKTTTKNGLEFEEWTSIKFPASLPPNIKVITAHLLSTQVLDD